MGNLEVFYLIHSLSSKNQILDFLMIFGAEFLIYIAFCLAFYFSFKGNRQKKALLLTLIAIVIGYLTVKFIRLFVDIPRPMLAHNISPLIATPDSSSFPSSHTTTMAILTFSFLYYRSKAAIFLIIFLIWVGLSRIYVGVHYPLDILGGVVIGLLSVSLAVPLLEYLKKYSRSL
ncbi:MAG: phosphatase PAP2 family protein [Candidatus Daviesbacteria bacterium]|nr:phosphatase PAP2 family protein [Candidatus Daviesbacteria bacterium]